MNPRYYIDINSETREIKPSNEKLSLKYEREDGQIFFRYKLQNAIEVGNIDDFNWLAGYKDSPCSEFIVRIEKGSDEIYRGIFSLHEVNFDFIEYRAELKPTTYDRYYDILKDQEDEKNIVNVAKFDDTQYISYQNFIEEEEEYIWTGVPQSFIDFAFLINPPQSQPPPCSESSGMAVMEYWYDFGTPDDLRAYYRRKWYLYRCQLRKITDITYEIKFFFRRYSAWFPRIDDNLVADFDNWENTNQTVTIDSNKFDRMGLLKPAAKSSLAWYSDSGYPENWCVYRIYPNYEESLKISYINHLSDLQAVMAYMYDGTISADYFDDTTEYQYLAIANKSDVKRKFETGTDPTEWVREWYMTWQNLTDILRKMFRIYWYIDNSGICVFLPMKSSYVEFVDFIDLTSQEYRNIITGNTMIENNIKNLPSISKFGFMEQGTPDFYGQNILYPACVNIKNEEDNGVNNITTDLIYMKNNVEDISEEGFVILALYKEGSVYKVRRDNTKWTENIYPNGALSWANLQDQNYKNDMPYAEATINNVVTDVNNDLTYRRPYLRKQVKITLCEGELPDFYSEPNKIKTIVTEHGTGIIDAFEYDFINNQAIIDIAFKDLSNA